MNNPIVAFLALAAVYYIGEFISAKTKAWIPSVFVTACLFLLGYWTIFPKDIVVIAGLGPPLGGTLVILLCITHMGTVISIKQLMEQWKIICITLAGLTGMIAFCWFIAMPMIGRDYVIAGLPPLTGGIVAATMMQQAAAEKGLMLASVFAIAMYSVQGFAGYPLTALVLKSEGKKLLANFRSGKVKKAEAGEVDNDTGNMKVVEVARKTLIPPMPDKYSTPALIFFKLMSVAYLAHICSKATGGKVNQAVLALVFGIIFTELGYLDKNSLQKSQSNGFLMYVLMIFVFAGLKDATPDMMKQTIGPMLLMVVIGVAGLALFSIAVGKFLKISWQMSLATSLTALYGFPPNYILTEEASKALAGNDEERQYLMDQMLPQMIVGGFVTVTITSVLVAGVFVNMF